MAHSVEEPHYVKLASIGTIEIRRYDPVVQAVTQLSTNTKNSNGFSRLAGYIFQGNDNDQAIAMTAPVQETLGAEHAEMAFTMPGQYTLESLPQPSDNRVTLRQVPARTVAVIRFSGWATSGKVARFTEQLKTTLAEQAIAISGAPVLNQYNPPWTAPFMRRNEVMLDVNWPD